MSAERRREEEELRRRLASRRLLDAIGSGGLEEDEADEVALRAVRRARREAGRGARPGAARGRARRGRAASLAGQSSRPAQLRTVSGFEDAARHEDQIP
jgi:hypothetical protein